ncbi:protein translocase subunit SecF [Histidinibacterium aquaticum]|uniref:Protein-export membrane protein SecF n=1 Tax=Histidinibacterium aquaticum TaxID=2613962 RepID=A0A5J5GMJ0_9RHOB|nr:protein translocase subunit SecF [Histidinibacterium aquaticum]KAA9008734.1 protein translocase subunit SecF [Histidinibacterium aquaticum]
MILSLIRRKAPAGATRYPFSRWSPLGLAVSAFLILATLVSLGLGGLNLSADFSGGTVVQARGEAQWDLTALRSDLAAAGIDDASVQSLDDGQTVLIRTRESGSGATEAITSALGPEARVLDAATVGPKVSAELLRSGLLSCLAAVTAIGAYIWIRFDARFALSAFLTTFHDTALMVGFFAVTRISFDLTSVAAILLIAGYSINDTVVVFDRLREVFGKRPDLPLRDAVDEAVTTTLRRTLMTSATTLATALSLLIFGGPVLFGFAAAVTFGLLLGTLSSIFVAAPLLLHLPGGLSGRARAEDGAPASDHSMIGSASGSDSSSASGSGTVSISGAGARSSKA